MYCMYVSTPLVFLHFSAPLQLQSQTTSTSTTVILDFGTVQLYSNLGLSDSINTVVFQVLSVCYILCACQFDDRCTLYTFSSLTWCHRHSLGLLHCGRVCVYGFVTHLAWTWSFCLFSNGDLWRRKIPFCQVCHCHWIWHVWKLKPCCACYDT